MKIELYLIRHGIAAEQDTYKNDYDRPLTAAGIKRTQQVFQRLGDLALQFDHVLTSPLIRAQQTAALLHQQGLCNVVEEIDCLAPDGTLAAWLDWLNHWWSTACTISAESVHRIALVGHQPNLGLWAECLVWGTTKSAIVLKKAGIIGITLPAPDRFSTGINMGSIVGSCQLFWLTAPKLLLT